MFVRKYRSLAERTAAVIACLVAATLGGTVAVFPPTLAAAQVPTVVSLAPASGNSFAQVFTAVYSDTAGASHLNSVSILVNSSVNGANSCYVVYRKSTGQLYLENDANTNTLSAVTPGSSTTVQNSQCLLNAAKSSITLSGNNATLQLALVFKPSFAGGKNVYLSAQDVSGTTSNWQLKGTWLVPPNPPDYSVTTRLDGVMHFYSATSTPYVAPTFYTENLNGQFSAADGFSSGVISYLGNDQWKLALTANQDLNQINFPYQVNRQPLDSDISDDIYYYPFNLGMTEKASNRNVDWNWFGLPNNGQFAPLVLLADPAKAHIVAATNWPPRKAVPYYGAERMILTYNESLAANATSTYQALVSEVIGDPVNNILPWQNALDKYRTWLNTQAPPVTYPDWMWSGQGFINVQLQNMTTYDQNYINAIWSQNQATYSWIQFWGQMGPALSAGGNCCALQQAMDPRYQPDLITFVNSVNNSGYHAGYYSIPYYDTSSGMPLTLLDTATGQSWLTSWIAQNQSYGANAFYVDTLAAVNWGDRSVIRNLMVNNTIPPGTMIEGVQDAYPRASLVSGSLVGGNYCGAPGKTPENSTSTTFPRFGRYLLNDRIMYEGASNGDFEFWGSYKTWQTDTTYSACNYPAYCSAYGDCDYGTESLAFLLGEKLDVLSATFGTPNPVLDQINSERIRVNWWTRRPVYLDTQGLDLSTVPAASHIQITRFKDNAGSTLLAVYNPTQTTGVTIKLDGRSVAVPTQKVSVLTF